MVKTTAEVDSLVHRFVERLERQVVVERVFVVGRYAFDKPHEDSDLRLVVISPTFEGMNLTKRIDILALAGLNIDPLIQSWGFTPGELTQNSVPLLNMQLRESREVYASPAASN